MRGHVTSCHAESLLWIDPVELLEAEPLWNTSQDPRGYDLSIGQPNRFSDTYSQIQSF